MWKARFTSGSTTVELHHPLGHDLALRALDAHLDHASYRQIAEGLFGRDAVSTQPWKTSDVRQRIIRLVQVGTKLMQGGYLDLLIYPHRRKR